MYLSDVLYALPEDVVLLVSPSSGLLGSSVTAPSWSTPFAVDILKLVAVYDAQEVLQRGNGSQLLTAHAELRKGDKRVQHSSRGWAGD